MKVAVFDRDNKARLLGHLNVSNPNNLSGCRYDVPVMQALLPTSMSDLYKVATFAATSLDHVRFDIEFRSESNRNRIDAVTEEVVTINRKVLETEAGLSDLLQLDNFTLPDETEFEAIERRRLQRVCR